MVTQLIAGVTTNVILMPHFSLWFSDIADLLKNDFGYVFPETFLFTFLELYEAIPITDKLNGFNSDYSCIHTVVKILVFKGSLKVILEQTP